MADNQIKGNSSHHVLNLDIDYNLNCKNDNDVSQFLSNLIVQKRYSGNKKSLSQVFEHFKYNRTLVALDELSYPDEIIDKLKELDINTNASSENIYIVENYLRSNVNQLNGILNII